MLTLPEALTDSDTVASMPSDAPWGEPDTPSTLSGAPSQDVSVGHTATWQVLTLTSSQDVPLFGSSAVTLPYQDGSAWVIEPGSFAGLAPSYTINGGAGIGQNAPEYNFSGTVNTTL